MLSTIGYTFFVFFTGGLAWWAPHFIEDALQYRNETLAADELSSDPSIEK